MHLRCRCLKCGHIMFWHPMSKDPPAECENCGSKVIEDEGTA